MRQVKASLFLLTMGTFTEPIEVTYYGKVIGVWEPAPQSPQQPQERPERTPQPTFNPAPKPGAKR